MALELRQQLKLAQKLVMTPQLRQAIKLLQLNRMELTDALHAELEQNPTLEEVPPDAEQFDTPESRNNEEIKDTFDFPENVLTGQVIADNPANMAEVNWADYANTFDTDLSFSRETPPADAPSQFDFISSKPGLEAHLMWQVSHLKLDEQELKIVEFIIGNLDGHGYLQVDLEEICQHANCDIETAQALLDVVQNFDPPGIAARNIQESLLLQLDKKGLWKSLAYEIVNDHMNLLEVRNFKKIAKETGTTVRKVMVAIDVITSLTPYPGNEFDSEQVKYVMPDVYVYKIDDEFVIQLNNDGLPNLQLSKEYLDIIKQKNVLNSESRGYLREQLRSADWFIKSIQQRQRTIYKVMESLLKFQHEFFASGSGQLKPLILRDVAEDISMHESTVSRVTSNKYVHTPQGIFELKYFFSTAVSTTDGDVVAAESIRNRIRQLVQEEDSTKPLSDNKISNILAKENIQVARRTVAKYRDQLKILPVKHRRKARVS